MVRRALSSCAPNSIRIRILILFLIRILILILILILFHFHLISVIVQEGLGTVSAVGIGQGRSEERTFLGFLTLLPVTDFCTCISRIFWKKIELNRLNYVENCMN